MTWPRLLGALLPALWVAFTWRWTVGDLSQPAMRLALAVLLAVGAVLAAAPGAARLLRRAVLAPPARWFLATTAFLAAAISWFVVVRPMHGQIISLDGAVYVFESRALTHLHFGMPFPPPRLPFGVRFLFEGPDGRLYGVFPPGFPAYLAPFVALGAPLAAGPVTAALLVGAVYALARAVGASELSARGAVLLSLPSWGRAIETADPLSHAFVALLFACALALALGLARQPRWWRAAGLGACVGWAFATRLLDGAVLAMVVVVVLAPDVLRRNVRPRTLAIAAAAALPFALLLGAQQMAATGSAIEPTQVAYFARADYPPTCHRLGFGADVGCRAEHPFERASFGDDGFTPDDAYRVSQERAGILGEDLFGLGLLLLLAFVPLVRSPERGELAALGLFLGLTAAYFFFYYGNLPIWGGRHLFPAAPCLWVLVPMGLSRIPARARGSRFDDDHVGGLGLAAVLAAVLAGQRPVWAERTRLCEEAQSKRTDLRAAIEKHAEPTGIVTTLDYVGTIAAYDSWHDARDRFIVLDDVHGLHELRLLRPELPVYRASAPDELVLDTPPVPPPGIAIELERAWPSFQYVDGLGAQMMNTPARFHVPSSGDFVLSVFESRPGATLTIPVWIASDGTFALTVQPLVGPDFGDYDVAFDGEALAPIHGYAKDRVVLPGTLSPPRHVSAGRHVLTFRCTGKAPESTGYLAGFDALFGLPVP